MIAESPAENLLLVIEVKTGRGDPNPEHRVDLSRRRRLARAASSLARDRAVAIEVVAVSIRPGGTEWQRFRLEPPEIAPSLLRPRR